MLAHLKAKQRELSSSANSDGDGTEGADTPATPQPSRAGKAQEPSEVDATEHGSDDGIEHEDATQMTCDVLCSLSASHHSPADYEESPDNSINDSISDKRKGKSCPKSHQLPMFLSSKSVFSLSPSGSLVRIGFVARHGAQLWLGCCKFCPRLRGLPNHTCLGEF